MRNMDFDALTGGIEPGGLRTKNEIRLLICYLLAGIDAPLAKRDIVQIMQENKLANYFEVMDALAEMIETKTVDTTEKNQLEQPEDCVCCNETTRSIARQLDTALPLSVRDRAVTAALELLARAKRQHENQVDLIHTEHGYQVICHISGGKMELMAITLYVPDLRQAQLVKENFQKNPQRIYSILLSSLTDNHIILKELLTDPQL